MRKIRIALGSDDGENVVANHMGTAKKFYIYGLFEDGNFVLVEARENTSPDEEGHGLIEKLKVVMNIFKDADVVLSRMASPNFVNMRNKTKFQPVVIKIDSISDSIKELSKYFEKIYSLVERRKNGERPKEMPVIGKVNI